MFTKFILRLHQQEHGFRQHLSSIKNTSEQLASKQSLYYRKANSSQDSWEREEEPPLSLLSDRGFYPLKMGGYQRGIQKDVVFSHWPCPVTYISPCPIGALGVEMPHKSHGFFALFFP